MDNCEEIKKECEVNSKFFEQVFKNNLSFIAEDNFIELINKHEVNIVKDTQEYDIWIVVKNILLHVHDKFNKHNFEENPTFNYEIKFLEKIMMINMTYEPHKKNESE